MPEACPLCGGEGYILEGAVALVKVPCPDCDGTGDEEADEGLAHLWRDEGVVD